MKIFKLILKLLVLFFLIFALSPVYVYLSGKEQIYTSIEDVQNTNIAIVFGAGLKASGNPSDVLMDRLAIAAELYNNQTIEYILVSGDNQIENYNEPEAMRDALIELGVEEIDIYLDYAGRRTYDTCIRANTLWGIDKAILISQGYHLPRAIWTCESLGIESTGLSGSLQPYLKQEYFEFREIFAIYKMMIDLYLIRPDFISGEVIIDLED